MAVSAHKRGMIANAVSALLARTGIASALGMQMSGNRDMYKVFGWNKSPKFADFVLKWKRQGVAKRVVNAYPDALWADPPVLAGDEAFNAAWQNVLAGIPVFAYLQKLDKLCRLGKFAILVVGLNDGKQLDQPISPVRDATKLRKIMYLQPYSEGSTTIVEWEKNTSSPRFGMPTMYQIDPGQFDNVGGDSSTANNINGPLESSFKVHWTRVLHVAEGALESPIYGNSCLENIFNDLEDLEKISGGSAEMFWLNSNRGMHIDVDKEVEMDAKDADALSEEIAEYTNQLTRVIRTRGVKVNPLGADYFDATNSYDVCMSNIAAGTGLPKRVLMGSEAGQLASQQDRANWAIRCKERISEYGNPVMLMPLLRLLIDAQVLPPPKSLTVTWPDSFKMNPLERAQTSAQMARSAANLAKMLYTVQQINHANAVDSMPTQVTSGGGGFFGNADPSKSTSGSAKTPTGKPPDAKGTGDNTSGSAPQVVETPALFDKKPPTITLLTEDECRQIIGFGKHMPVFDSTADSQASGVGDNSSTAVAGGGVDQTPNEDQ